MAEVAGCFSRLYRPPPRLPGCFHRFRRPPPRLPGCFHRFRRPPSRLPNCFHRFRRLPPRLTDDGSHFFLQLFSFSLSVPDGGGALTTADATSPGLFFPTRRLEKTTRRLVNTIGRLCARCAMPRLVSAAAEHTTPFSRVARWGFAWCAWPSGPTFRQTDNFQRNIKYVNSFLNFSFGVTLHRKKCMAISNHE